jgi:hypothetical protein
MAVISFMIQASGVNLIKVFGANKPTLFL